MTPTPDIIAARAHWQWRGDVRPDFAVMPKAGEESVWDYPRPPRIEPVEASLTVAFGDDAIAATHAGQRVLETSHPPTFYFPPEDVRVDHLSISAPVSHCEWKGLSANVSTTRGDVIGWRLVKAYNEFRELEGWFSFYPARVACSFDGERVAPQPGPFYGGWVVRGITGPFKGAPGSSGW